MSSSGLLYHYIRGNYKWPRAGDGEPIRSQIGCQPKTNCLLALTEGFYLHNSNPKPKQSALTTPITQLFTSASREKPRPLGRQRLTRETNGVPWVDRSRPLAAPKKAPTLPRGPPRPRGPFLKAQMGDGLEEGRGDREEQRASREMSACLRGLPTTAYTPNPSPRTPSPRAGLLPAASAPHPPEDPRSSKGPGERKKGSTRL